MAVSESSLDAEVEKLTSRLARGPTTAMAGSKILRNQAALQGLGDLLSAEAESLAKGTNVQRDCRRGSSRLHTQIIRRIPT